MRVNSSVAMRTELFIQFHQQPVDGFAFGREQFKQHQTGQDTVAFGDVTGKTDAAAFFRAKQHIALEHLGTNILEADAGFDERQPIGRAYFVHHRSRRERFHHTSPALAVHNQMMQQQADDLVCRERITVTVHAANAVGIAVGHETKVVGMFF